MNDFDSVVIGHGLSACAAAVSLRKKGKRVTVIYRTPGTTSVSSGAWDYGPIGSYGQSLHDACASEAWRSAYGKVLPGGVPNEKRIEEVSREVAQALSTLPMTLRFEKSLLLPTTLGTWKSTFAAQTVQAKADAEGLKGKAVRLLSSPKWRFDANGIVKGLKAEKQIDIETIEVPFEGITDDCALPHFSSRCADPEFFAKVVDSIKKHTKGVEVLLCPPIFLDTKQYSDVEAAIGVSVAECLATKEPIPGFRLYTAIASYFKRADIVTREAKHIEPLPVSDRIVGVKIFEKEQWTEIRGKEFVLATGKFFGGGVKLGYHTLRETVFDFPLFIQREGKAYKYRNELDWRSKDFDESQEWAKLGVRVDEGWRVLDESGAPVYENVRACGSVLGGIDFSRAGVGLGFMLVTGSECGHGI